MGPLLFLFYINDTEENLTSTIRVFGNDSAIYRKIDSIEDAHILQKDLFQLQEWADKQQMSLNVKKCKTLRITMTKINYFYVMLTPSSLPSHIEIEEKNNNWCKRCTES